MGLKTAFLVENLMILYMRFKLLSNALDVRCHCSKKKKANRAIILVKKAELWYFGRALPSFYL